MGVGSGLYMYDVVVERSRSLSYLLMSSCLYMLPMAVASSCSDKGGIRYVLPVLWMTSRLHILSKIKQITSYDSLLTLGFRSKRFWRNSNEVGPTMAPNTSGVNWNWRFSTKISLYLGIGRTCYGHYSYNGQYVTRRTVRSYRRRGEVCHVADATATLEFDEDCRRGHSKIFKSRLSLNYFSLLISYNRVVAWVEHGWFVV